MPKRILHPDVYNYKNQLKTYLATTRFNNKTWKENQDFLKKQKMSHNIKCIYPCSTAISSDNIPFKANIFILEMNNEINKIMGIGLIKNTTPEYNKYKIYDVDKLNAFTYIGGYYISYKELNDDEIKIISALEQLCFKGKRHQKRLSGIKAFPLDILYSEYKKNKDYIGEIANMFKKRYL